MKKNSKYIYGVLLTLIISLFIISCFNTERGISQLPKDIQTFIYTNTDDLYFFSSVFMKKNGKVYDLCFDTVRNEDHLSSIIHKNNLLFSCQSIEEKEDLNNINIFSNTERALSLLKQNPWKIHIPDSIAFNYLLPYKVLFEKTGNWQKIFNDNFGSVLNHVPNTKLSKRQIDSLIEVNVIKLDTGHIFTGRESIYRICSWPGISEMMMAKSGDCQSESIKNVYLYRSLGIPAAIDFTPFYGGGNAGHSSAVFWDSDLQKFRAKAGQGFNPDYRVSKVFRWSFKKTNVLKNKILPYLSANMYFPIEELQNNHWIDVTEDHTQVKDLSLNIPEAYGKIAFICTYTYGKWKPIFYGIKTKDSNFQFTKMATDVLYRGAYYDNKGQIKMQNAVFILKKDGTTEIVNKEKTAKNIKVELQRNNYGGEAWVKRDKKYSLLGLNINGEWDTVFTQKSHQDSLISFPKTKSTYKILALMEHSANRRLERPFLIYKDSIVWY